MNQRGPKIQSANPTVQGGQPSRFCRWEKIPLERQHELIIALTAMLVKRLPDQRTPKGGSDE
jgi:hypothetical protein